MGREEAGFIAAGSEECLLRGVAPVKVTVHSLAPTFPLSLMFRVLVASLLVVRLEG